MKRRLKRGDDSDADVLLHYMNAQFGGDVQKFFKDFQRLVFLNEKAKACGVSCLSKEREGYDETALSNDIYFLGLQMNEKLHLSPFIDRTAAGIIKVEWRSSEKTISETRALQALLGVVESGQILSFDICKQCFRWYLRRRHDQRFCDRKCRQNNWNSDPENRERRNEYLRKNYRDRVALGK